MTPTLPSYQDLVRKIENLPSDAKQKALVAMKAEVTKDATRKSLEEEVDKLTGAAKEINNAFQSIRLKLHKADLIAARDMWKGHVSYVDGWVELQERFTNLLVTSRQSAVDLKVFIKRYLDNVIDVMNNPKATREQRQGVLSNFIKQCTGNENPQGQSSKQADKAWNLALEFERLARDVKEFSVSFMEVGAKQEKEWKARIQQLNGEIKIIDLELTNIQQRIIKWSALLGVAITGGAAGAGIALWCMGPLGPFVAGGIAIAGLVAAGVFGKELADALNDRTTEEDKLKSKQQELDTIKGQLEILGQVKTDMAGATRSAEAIVERLASFKDIWNCLADQARKCENYIDDTISATTNYEFKKDIELTQACFAVLEPALDKYALLLNDSEL